MNKSSKRFLGFAQLLLEFWLVLLVAGMSIGAAWVIYGLKHDSSSPPTPIQQEQQVAVYFNNSKLDPEFLCYLVFPVYRTVPDGASAIETALAGLLAGPTDMERELGYFTTINDNTQLLSVRVEGDTAYVDFDRQLGFEVGGSCRVGAIRAQIVKTVQATTDVENVVISIEGNANEILEP